MHLATKENIIESVRMVMEGRFLSTQGHALAITVEEALSSITGQQEGMVESNGWSGDYWFDITVGGMDIIVAGSMYYGTFNIFEKAD